MIDSLSETLISLADAARSCPTRRSGKRPHLSCVYRWTTVGCKGVVLESIQVGGTRCTSREALRRFFGELTAAKANQPAPQVRRADSASVRQAERALAAVGI